MWLGDLSGLVGDRLRAGLESKGENDNDRRVIDFCNEKELHAYFEHKSSFSLIHQCGYRRRWSGGNECDICSASEESYLVLCALCESSKMR